MSIAMQPPVPEKRKGQKRTKIVATIGPATNSLEAIRNLACEGVDVFRLNFSHGNHESHLEVIRHIRLVCVERSRPYAILGDLSGPKIRLGDLAEQRMPVSKGDTIRLTSQAADGTGYRFHVTMPSIHLAMHVGQVVLVDDGTLQFTVTGFEDEDVLCVCDVGGVLLPRKGVNLPNADLPIPALTEKDRDDLAFALTNDVDLIALSFVRSVADLELARGVMRNVGRVVPLLAKIEKSEAVAHLDEIVASADGIMVARGDLGIEVPMETVPTIQKRAIRLCNLQHKPVITATQMLDSMIRNPVPTRAEVTDVFNAIVDGTDAVMLSGETASGAYPLEAVRAMDRIAGEAEQHIGGFRTMEWVEQQGQELTTSMVAAHAAVSMAQRLKVDCILAPTWTGRTAQRVSQWRPTIPVFSCGVQTDVVNPLCLVWGVESRLMENLTEADVQRSETDSIVDASVRCAMSHGFLSPGMKAVVITGVPLGSAGMTNLIRVVYV